MSHSSFSTLTYLTLTPASKSLFDETLEFYTAIGFQVLATDIANDVWLYLHPALQGDHSVSGIAIRVFLGTESTHKLAKPGPFNEEEFRKNNSLLEDELKLEAKNPDLIAYSINNPTPRGGINLPWAHFNTTNILHIKKGLDGLQKFYATAIDPSKRGIFIYTLVSEEKSLDEDVKNVIKNGGYVFIKVYDPLGNLLAFTNSPSIFIRQSFRSKSVASLDELVESRGTSAPSITGHLSSSGAKRKKRIGILTSGGDSCGMNAAVRSIARVSLNSGCVPYAIYEGYQGLVDGGNSIRELGWEDVRSLLSVGGTSIGTARCKAFRDREGRLKAAKNLISNGIDALVVIGGDGSLTGADFLRAEWSGLLDELIERKEISKEECDELRDLTIVGLVGSIDNDMSMTDCTIGAVTCLHRICEAVDSITSTALSHQRAFVIEVMGRRCGWLGLMAGIAVGADWVFLPEHPPPLDTETYGNDWRQELCDVISKYRSLGNRKSLVIVCEGAIDRDLTPIKSEDVRKVLSDRLQLDTRVTCLGHVQRGGIPCAFDRFLATVQGMKAVRAVLDATPETPAPMIGINQNDLIAVPLMEAVKKTHELEKAINSKDFTLAMSLRDPEFAEAYDTFMDSVVSSVGAKYKKASESEKIRVGVLHVGAPAGGMNAATRTITRTCINKGHTVLGISNGFAGLIRGEVRELTWADQFSWQFKGGSDLGTSRAHPRPLSTMPEISPKGHGDFVDLGMIAFSLQRFNIQSLIIIGGFEAFTSQLVLTHARTYFPPFCIPMVQLPATVSNNVPGTDYSIGCDTALNSILSACDTLKLSATASRNRVFVVEVQGGNCGYLASLGGLVSGATTLYTPEEGISIKQIEEDIRHLKNRYRTEKEAGFPSEGRVIIVSENASSTYKADVIAKILKAEGKGLFDARTATLGHLQQGSAPSPLDRIRATSLAYKCVNWIIETVLQVREEEAHGLTAVPGRTHDEQKAFSHYLPLGYTRKPEHSCVVGILGSAIVLTPIEKLLPETELVERRSKKQWWRDAKRLTKVLSKYYFHEDEIKVTDYVLRKDVPLEHREIKSLSPSIANKD